MCNLNYPILWVFWGVKMHSTICCFEMIQDIYFCYFINLMDKTFIAVSYYISEITFLCYITYGQPQMGGLLLSPKNVTSYMSPKY